MWTGYFTSRPAFKLHERDANALLQSARQAKVLFRGDDRYLDSLRILQRALGVAQHHDAITGTAKTHVDQDYHHMLA